MRKKIQGCERNVVVVVICELLIAQRRKNSHKQNYSLSKRLWVIPIYQTQQALHYFQALVYIYITEGAPAIKLRATST